MARCLARGCPTRWRSGPDRVCGLHDDQDYDPALIGPLPKRRRVPRARAPGPGSREQDLADTGLTRHPAARPPDE
jgi:hypothetical protein